MENDGIVMLLIGGSTLAMILAIIFFIDRDQKAKTAVKKIRVHKCDDEMATVLRMLNKTVVKAKKTPFHKHPAIHQTLVQHMGGLRRMFAMYVDMVDVPSNKDIARQEIIDTAILIQNTLDQYLDESTGVAPSNHLKEIKGTAAVIRGTIDSQ